jgi:DNA-binding CsgD family transcriptional regulator
LLFGIMQTSAPPTSNLQNPSSLQNLFLAIGHARDDKDLHTQIAPKIGAHFQAKRRTIFFFDQLPLLDPNLQKIMQVGLSVERNPVVRYLVEHHAPVHEAMVTTPKVWQMICPRADHWHVMAGPIVSRSVSGSQLVGAVGCTREQSQPAFSEQDVADLSAICLHLSVWAATVRFCGRQDINAKPEPLWQPVIVHPRLTVRELEIAELVALGHTNAEISKALWITENSVKQALKRMFRKLEVSSRAEMVAQLLTASRDGIVAQL